MAIICKEKKQAKKQKKKQTSKQAITIYVVGTKLTLKPRWNREGRRKLETSHHLPLKANSTKKEGTPFN